MNEKLIQNKFILVTPQSIHQIFKGKDINSRKTLLVLSPIKPSTYQSNKLKSSETVEITINQRLIDNYYSITFSLRNNQLESVFDSFCENIIDNVNQIKDKNLIIDYLCNRYIMWQKLFTKGESGLLSENELKGLIGELYFLEKIMIPNYGQVIAISSWLGPEKAPQDFVCSNIWYEIKSSYSPQNVTINSIEQLDSNMPGYLIVIEIQKTSIADTSGITINKLVENIKNNLTEENKQIFTDILLSHGYCNLEEYNFKVFKILSMDFFEINQDSPVLHKSQLPPTIISATYTLNTALLKKQMRSQNE